MSNPGEVVAEFPKLEFPTRRVTVNIVATFVLKNEDEASAVEQRMQHINEVLTNMGAEHRVEYQTN